MTKLEVLQNLLNGETILVRISPTELCNVEIYKNTLMIGTSHKSGDITGGILSLMFLEKVKDSFYESMTVIDDTDVALIAKQIFNKLFENSYNAAKEADEKNVGGCQEALQKMVDELQ